MLIKEISILFQISIISKSLSIIMNNHTINIFEKNLILLNLNINFNINYENNSLTKIENNYDYFSHHIHRNKRDKSVIKIVTVNNDTEIKPRKMNKELRINAVFENDHKLGKVRIFRSSKVLTILGLFELSRGNETRYEGYSELRAAEMAIKHMNQLKLVPGYMFELLVNDTQVK